MTACDPTRGAIDVAKTAQTTPGPEPSGSGLLFVQTAGAGTFDDNLDGSYPLTLTAVPSTMTWFADRPNRQVGTQTVATFADNWDAYGVWPRASQRRDGDWTRC